MVRHWNLSLKFFVLCSFSFWPWLLHAYPTAPVHRGSAEIRPGDIAVVMAWDQIMEEFWVPRTLQDKVDYTNKHGYQLIIYNDTSDARSASWSKIINLHRAMTENPDKLWFWWVDVDSLIMEPQYSIEDHILAHVSRNPYFEKDIVLSWDCNGLNTGSMFLRNSDWSLKLLQDLLELSWLDPIMYGEQRKMQTLFHASQEMADHFNFIPLRKACAALQHRCRLDRKAAHQYNYHKGDFLIHFANCAPNRCHKEVNHYHNLLYSK